MTKKGLQALIGGHGIETNWIAEQLFAWLPPHSLCEFVEANKGLFDDGPIENCSLYFDGTIKIDLTDICAYWEIDPKRITKKKAGQ